MNFPVTGACKTDRIAGCGNRRNCLQAYARQRQTEKQFASICLEEVDDKNGLQAYVLQRQAAKTGSLSMDLPENNPDKRAYVLYTNTNYMSRIKAQMENFVLTEEEKIYSPMIERIKRIRGVDREVMSYMFPGYLFINTQKPKDLYLRIRSAMGEVIFRYCRVLREDTYICPISPEEQENIKQLCDEEYVMKCSEGYLVGDQLIVTKGPLRDFQGKILKINRHKKIAVIGVSLLGDTRPITVGLEVVRKVEAGESVTEK